MKKVTTRLISAALAASMMLSVCPVGAFAAAEETEFESGISTQAVEDITNQGLNLSTSAPTEKTTYQAGAGTVTYDPDSRTLTLSNADIETSKNTIVAPDGVLNIVVEGENTLTSTSSNAIYCTKKTTDINISGNGTLNVQAAECGITDDDEQSSVLIKGTTVNFKCEDTAIYMANNIRFENAKIDIDGIDDPYGIEVFDGGLFISGSTVTIENVEYAFAVGRNNESRIQFEIVNNSDVTIENAYSCTIASNALIEDSTYVQKDSHFSREGSTSIKNSTFIVKTTQSVAFDSWYGGLEVSGDSYVELESAKNAFKLAKTSECLTLGAGLSVLEGEMDAEMQASTTARLVIGKLYHVMVDGSPAGDYKQGEEVTLTAKEPAEDEVFTGWKVAAPKNLDVTTDGLNITFTMPAEDVELETIYDAKTITELDPDKYEGLEENDETGGVTVKPDYELELPDSVVAKVPVENKGTIVSGKFEETVTGGTIKGGTYLEVKDADSITGGVFAQVPELKQGDVHSVMDLLKVVDADDTLMKQCAVNDIIVPRGENNVDDVEPVAFIIGEQTVTVKYTDDNDAFAGWTSQDIDLTQAKITNGGRTLTFDVTALGDKVITIKATYRDDVDPDDIPDSSTDSEIGGALAAVVVAAGAGIAGYELGLHLYRWTQMGIAYWPANRQEMALLIWERANKPEPTSTELFEDIDAEDADAQKAARWMVEQELMQVDDDQPTKFQPLKAVPRLRVCLTWHDAQEKGLIQ